MLAYAPRPTATSSSPRAFFIVATGHAVAIALVLTARSDYVKDRVFDPTDIVFVPTKPPPPPPPSDPAPPTAPSQSTIDTPRVIIPTPPLSSDPIIAGPPITSFDPIIGNAVEPPPMIIPDPPGPAIIRRAARFITAADQVRPPYPVAQQRIEEEASLRLSLSIDPRGRVTSVSPVGAADPIFLDAARRHILRHWRYQPASEGGEAIASNVVITLTFKLED